MIQILTHLCSEFGKRMRVQSFIYVYENVLLLHFLCDSKKIKVFFFVNLSKTITSRPAAGLLNRKRIIILEIFAKLISYRCEQTLRQITIQNLPITDWCRLFEVKQTAIKLCKLLNVAEEAVIQTKKVPNDSSSCKIKPTKNGVLILGNDLFLFITRKKKKLHREAAVWRLLLSSPGLQGSY